MNNTRRQIIETAFLLFLKKGFKAVRLSDIERAAKITRGTFYYHFTNKEEVLKEGLYSYYALLNSKRTEEFGHISTLREYVDLTIQKLTGIDRPELYWRIDNELQWCIHDSYTEIGSERSRFRIGLGSNGTFYYGCRYAERSKIFECIFSR